MASQILSGTGDVTYSNNTGENVRFVINYMKFRVDPLNGVVFNPGTLLVSWGANGSVTTRISVNSGTMGRGIAGMTRSQGDMGLTSHNYVIKSGANQAADECDGIPTELMLAPGDTVSYAADTTSGTPTVNITEYNIVVIPEGG